MVEENSILISVIGLLCGMLIFTFIAIGVNSVSLNQVGEYMCEQQGYEFKSAKAWTENEKFQFKVICKQNTTTPIEDGYLVLE